MSAPTTTLLLGDCTEVLKSLPDSSVHTCISSPPYFGLRDYGTAEWEGGSAGCDHQPKHPEPGDRGSSTITGGTAVLSAQKLGVDAYRESCPKCGARRLDHQIGLEAGPADYTARLVAVFREVRRVLRTDGSLWLNLGDSYAGGGGFSASAPSTPETKSGRYGLAGALRTSGVPATTDVKNKDLFGIPWQVAIAMRADGWYLRQSIPWLKKNSMPESVTDRPTTSVESIFLLAPSADYYHDRDAVKRGPGSTAGGEDGGGSRQWRNSDAWRDSVEERIATARAEMRYWESVRAGGPVADEEGRILAMDVNTSPFALAHFAAFPPKLIEPMIRSSTGAKGCCSACGACWQRVAARAPNPSGLCGGEHREPGRPGGLAVNRPRDYDAEASAGRSRTLGWEPACSCDAGDPIPCTVMDPFMGSGTVGETSRALGRSFVGIDLNPEYLEMARLRIDAMPSYLGADLRTKDRSGQLGLFGD